MTLSDEEKAQLTKKLEPHEEKFWDLWIQISAKQPAGMRFCTKFNRTVPLKDLHKPMYDCPNCKMFVNYHKPSDILYKNICDPL